MDEAKVLTSDIDEVLESGGFHIKKWTTNASINEGKPFDEHAMGDSKDNTENVLGAAWIPKEDKLSFKIKADTADAMISKSPTVQFKLTKQNILSKLAAIFDPIGIGAAIIVKAKIALQELWQLGLDWDDDISHTAKEKWTRIFEDLAKLNFVKFDCCLTPPNVVGKPSIIVFCNASRLAFGAVAYIRWKRRDGKYDVRFVAAKSRVAPLKELTIP